MKKIEQSMRQIIEERLYYQLALSLANRIMLELGIPEGNFLPGYLEFTHCRSNLDAVLNWLLKQQGYDLKLATDKNQLKAKFHRLLIDLEDQKGRFFPL